jgi:hypothetical protein
MLLLSLKTDVRDAWYNLCIIIDNLIYSMVSYSYRIFLLLANGTPFKYDDYKAITLRIYVVLGIIMMFVMTYELFILIINPDDTKNSNPGKLIINICLTVVVLVLLPTLFGFLANTQNAFLNNDFLGKLILGTGYDTSGSSTSCDGSSDTIRRGGNMIAGQVFQSFFVPADGKDAADIKTDEGDGSFVCLTQSNGVPLKSSDLQSAFNCASTYGNFDVFYKFSGRAAEGDITFNALFSILAGVFLCYVIISFCFDLGIRVVKIAFLQLIAPIPVILRIIPKGKDIFNNWFKMLISVYLEAFVRIASMYLGVFLIALFLKSDTTWISNCENNKFLLLLAKAFVIMGIFASIKILPEMLKKLFPGMDSGGMKLGIKDKLAAGGAFMAGAAGAGLTGAMATILECRNFHANKCS